MPPVSYKYLHIFCSFKINPPSGSENGLGGHELGSASDEASFHVARDSPHNSSASPDYNASAPPLFDASAVEPLLQKLNSNADSIERVAREMELLRVSGYAYCRILPGFSQIPMRYLSHCRFITFSFWSYLLIFPLVQERTTPI